MKKATIKDVAREAGVSVATASNAMNNPEIVKPQTREAVLEAGNKIVFNDTYILYLTRKPKEG